MLSKLVGYSDKKEIHEKKSDIDFNAIYKKIKEVNEIASVQKSIVKNNNIEFGKMESDKAYITKNSTGVQVVRLKIDDKLFEIALTDITP